MLTAAQRQTLVRYRQHRDRPFTMADFVRPMLPHLLSAAALGLACLLFASRIVPQVSLFVAGMCAGVILRQVALAFAATRVIPVVLQVLDWDEVDRLLDEHAQRAEGRHSR